MPKVKTKRAAAKRMKLTASGKVKIKKAGTRHILEHKSAGKKRSKRKGAYVTQLREARNIKRCIPYLQIQVCILSSFINEQGPKRIFD